MSLTYLTVVRRKKRKIQKLTSIGIEKTANRNYIERGKKTEKRVTLLTSLLPLDVYMTNFSELIYFLYAYSIYSYLSLILHTFRAKFQKRKLATNITL